MISFLCIFVSGRDTRLVKGGGSVTGHPRLACPTWHSPVYSRLCFAQPPLVLHASYFSLIRPCSSRDVPYKYIPPSLLTPELITGESPPAKLPLPSKEDARPQIDQDGDNNSEVMAIT
jgi:hypothetical protein